MKAKDLRIGNYTDKGRVFNIYYSNAEEYVIETDDLKPIPINGINPIPLTEEWHNKFGAKKNRFMSFEYNLPMKNNFDITVIFNGDYVMLRQGENKCSENDIVSIWNKDLTKRDMYVHEWQNLYSALTGAELKLK